MIFNALSIAGTDPSGGAGIQADLKTFSALGVYGTTVITALVAQNTQGVAAIHQVPGDFVAAQLQSLFDDVRIDAVKIGMLGTAEVIEAVVAALKRHRPPYVVLDPVMVATSGDHLLTADAMRALREKLLPVVDLVTPNLPEAAALLGEDEATSEEDMLGQLQRLHRVCPGVLIKGGHLDSGNRVVDMLYDGDVRTFRGQRFDTTSTHGTGCTLSAAITAQLANGESLHAAVRRAIDYVHNAIATAPGLGSGHGPLNHLAEDH